jgi:ABC-type multidrug transport system fused ATPase/permease subunit
MIIIASKHAEFAQFNDQVLILDVGISVEYGSFGELTANSESRIKKFHHSKETDLDKDTDSKSITGDVV